MITQLLLRFKLLLVLFICCAGLVTRAFAQESVQVPGSKFKMAAPEVFTLATGFVGFQHAEKNASIMLVFMPGPFAEVSKGLTAGNLLKTGVTMSKMDSMTIDQYPARWIEGSQKAYGSTFLKRMLVYGDAKKTIMVSCAYPEEHKELEQLIVKAALSVRYGEQLGADSLAHSVILIDVRGTDFSLFSHENKILSYKSATDQSANPALFMAAPSLGQAVVSDQKAFAISRLKKLPGAGAAVIKETKGVEIDGMKGFETLAEIQAAGKKSLIYQVMLFNDKNQYYIMVGTASTNLDANLSTFKKLAGTFKRI